MLCSLFPVFVLLLKRTWRGFLGGDTSSPHLLLCFVGFFLVFFTIFSSLSRVLFSANETFAPSFPGANHRSDACLAFCSTSPGLHRHKDINKTKQNFIFKTGRGRKTSLCLLLEEARVAFAHLKVLLCIPRSSSSLCLSPSLSRLSHALFPLLLNLYYCIPALLNVLFSLPSRGKKKIRSIFFFLNVFASWFLIKRDLWCCWSTRIKTPSFSRCLKARLRNRADFMHVR